MKSGRFARPLLGLATLLIWALAAGSVLFWALRLGGAGAPSDTPPAGGGTGGVAVDAQALARALGAVTTASATPAPDLLGRLALRGLLTHDGRGAALISVDGKPAKPVRVGAPVHDLDGGWQLRSVSPREAVLAADGMQARLEMPPLAGRTSSGAAVLPPTVPVAGRPIPGPVPRPLPPPAGTVPTPRPGTFPALPAR